MRIEPLEERALLAAIPISFPGQATGTLAQSDDSAMYSVDVTTAGESLLVDLDATQSSPHNRLYVRFGAEPTQSEYDFVAAEPNLADQYLSVPSSSVGTYYVMVLASYVPTSDDFTLRVDTTASLSSVAIPGQATGTLAQDGDHALYRVDSSAAGDFLIFDLDSSDSWAENELYVRFEDLPTRTAYDIRAAEPNTSDQYLSVSSSQVGTYYVMVYTSYPSSSNDYTLRVDTSSSLPSIAIPGEVSGSLDQDGDHALFRVDNTTAGDSLIFELDADDNFLPSNELYVRFGNLPTRTNHDYSSAEPSSSDQFLVVPSAQVGTYYVMAYASDAFPSDDYTLRVDTTASLTSIPIPGQAAGTLYQEGEYDLYRVENTTADEFLIFDLDAADSWTYNELYVRYENVPTRTTHDFAAAELNAADQYLSVPSARVGTYYVMVYASDASTNDDYILRVDTADTLAAIGIPGQATGTLYQNGDHDLYRVDNAVAGEALVFDLDAADSLPNNELYVRYGDLPTRADHDFVAAEPNSADQYLLMPLAQAGTYYVLVYAPDTTGNDQYTLRVDTTDSLVDVDVVAIVRDDGTALPADPKGEAAALPGGLDWMNEWDSCLVEVWVGTANTSSTGIVSAQVDLEYNTDYFTATSIEYGPGFGSQHTGTIDDQAGLVDNLGAQAATTDVGDDQYALLARVRFAPAAADPGVPLGGKGKYLTAVPSEFDLLNVALTLDGSVAASWKQGAAPDTELWPVMYDIDDSGRVDFGDLAYFAAAFQQMVDDPGATHAYASDFDRSGKVDFGDLAYFAANFQREAGDSVGPLAHAGSFPDAYGSLASEVAAKGMNFLAAITHPTSGLPYNEATQSELDSGTGSFASAHFVPAQLGNLFTAQVLSNALRHQTNDAFDAGLSDADLLGQLGRGVDSLETIFATSGSAYSDGSHRALYWASNTADGTPINRDVSVLDNSQLIVGLQVARNYLDGLLPQLDASLVSQANALATDIDALLGQFDLRMWFNGTRFHPGGNEDPLVGDPINRITSEGRLAVVAALARGEISAGEFEGVVDELLENSKSESTAGGVDVAKAPYFGAGLEIWAILPYLTMELDTFYGDDTLRPLGEARQELRESLGRPVGATNVATRIGIDFAGFGLSPVELGSVDWGNPLHYVNVDVLIPPDAGMMAGTLGTVDAMANFNETILSLQDADLFDARYGVPNYQDFGSGLVDMSNPVRGTLEIAEMTIALLNHELGGRFLENLLRQSSGWNSALNAYANSLNLREAETALPGPGSVVTRTNAGGDKAMHLANVNDSARYNVEVHATGSYELTTRYSNDDLGAGDTLSVYVDGDLAGSLSMADTGNWNSFSRSLALPLGTLAAGSHEIKFELAATDGYGVDLDWFRVATAGSSAPLVLDTSSPASSSPASSSPVPAAGLSEGMLASIVEEAANRMASSQGSADLEMAGILDTITVDIVDLPGNLLGQARGNHVWIDRDAAGRGWFVDTTPGDDVEFSRQSGTDELMATFGSRAAGRVDLLTTLMHELGHVLGEEHTTGPGLMHDALSVGTRWLPGGDSSLEMGDDEPYVDHFWATHG